MTRSVDSGWRLRRVGLGLVVLALVLVSIPSGCQHSAPVPGLRERAQKYWGLKQSKGWAEVYEKYLDPTVKTNLTKEAFLKRRFLAFDILSYEISEINETGDKATVAVANEVNFPLKTPEGELKFIKKQVTTNDTWVKQDGVWYVELSE